MCKAELRPPKVDPYSREKKITFGGVPKTWQATILTLEQREDFFIERPQLGLKDSLPPFAIHILNRLDIRIHQVAPKIYHTYSKI